MTRQSGFPAGAFDKEDRGSDLAFYAEPRLVTHIDEGAIAALTGFYAATIPPRAVVLDLMSSWVSHLPEDLATAEVIGHGMNAVELAANPRLDRWFIADLNDAPTLPLADASVDAVLCCVGVQYLQQPVEVFGDVRRILRPGGLFIASYANRCFPTKAVRLWRALSMAEQAELIRLYMAQAGFATAEATVLADGTASDPMVAVTGRRD